MPIQKWEYRYIAFHFTSWNLVNGGPGSSLDMELERLGAEGWELVQIVGPTGGSKDIHVAYMKRSRA